MYKIEMDAAEIPTDGDLRKYEVHDMHVLTVGPAGGNAYLKLRFAGPHSAARFAREWYGDADIAAAILKDA